MLRIKIHPAFMLTLTERQELIVRIKALVQKTQRNTETEDAFVIGDYRLDPVAQKLYHLGEIDEELSYRETEILKRLCRNKDQIVNSQDILLDLWGDDSFFNSRSLHVFITKLRHKLSKDPRIRILNIRGIGYKLTI